MYLSIHKHGSLAVLKHAYRCMVNLASFPGSPYTKIAVMGLKWNEGIVTVSHIHESGNEAMVITNQSHTESLA